MRALFSALTLSIVLITGAVAQTKSSSSPTGAPATDSGKTKSGAKVADAMNHLPPGIADKINAAREAAKAAKAEIDAMNASGSTPEQITAMIEQRKAAALLNLQKALDALGGLPDATKENVAKAKDVVAKRLDERKAEAKPTP